MTQQPNAARAKPRFDNAQQCLLYYHQRLCEEHRDRDHRMSLPRPDGATPGRRSRTPVPVDAPHSTSYHDGSLTRCTEYGGMADHETIQQPVDPLTVSELITLQEAAAYCQLQAESLQEYAKNGRLRAKKMGRFWVTTRAAVDEYLASRDLESIPRKYRKGA